SVVRCCDHVLCGGAACPLCADHSAVRRREEDGCFEPQGLGFFLLLMVVFGGLLVWVALARQLVFRVLAACLPFLPAMVFGVAAVNRYYDYYQTWGGMINDLTSQGAGNLPKYAAGGK